MTNPTRFFYLQVCLLLISSNSMVWAQVASTGAIFGTIVDNSGAAVAAASITVVNQATQVKRNLTSHDGGPPPAWKLGGRYEFGVGPAARYSCVR